MKIVIFELIIVELQRYALYFWKDRQTANIIDILALKFLLYCKM